MADLKFADVLKDPKLALLVKAYTTKEHSDENYLFLTEKASNEVLYKKYIDPKSAKQVNLPNDVQKALDVLAGAKKFGAMSDGIKKAQAEILKLMERDTLKRFVATAEYLKYLESKNPEAPKTKALIPVIEKEIVEGAKFFTGALAALKAKGVPADKVLRGRMFQSGRMRHDKVAVPFTDRVQKDKSFTRAKFEDLFKKKDAFTKLWGEYGALVK